MRTSQSSHEIIENYRRKQRIAQAVKRRKRAELGLLPDQKLREAMNKHRLESRSIKAFEIL